MTTQIMVVDALTADGAIVRLRPVRRDDVPALVELYSRASSANLQMRFFHLPSEASIALEARRSCRPAGPEHRTVVAELGDALVGVASYERRGRRHAEFAVFVDDRQHGRGIGTLLLEQLAGDARRHGVADLTGDVLGGNTPMLTVARDLAGAVVVGDPDAPPTCGVRHTHVFSTPERASRALGHAMRYAAWRREPFGERPVLAEVDAAAARRVVRAGISAGGSWQPYERTAAILNAYGIPLVDTVSVDNSRDAVIAAGRMGGPVAVTCGDPELVHKTDLGAVRLNLTDPGEVQAAARRVAAVGRSGQPVLVQRMAVTGVEFAAAIVHDPLFGSLLMAGMGGVRADILDDRAFRLVPLTDLDAGRMWRSLRGAPLLTGYRGTPPIDTAAIEDLLLRLGRLAEDHPEVAELDLNPIMAGPDGVTVLDAKLRLHENSTESDPLVRALTAC